VQRYFIPSPRFLDRLWGLPKLFPGGRIKRSGREADNHLQPLPRLRLRSLSWHSTGTTLPLFFTVNLYSVWVYRNQYVSDNVLASVFVL
jgi:hypothetical protein